MKRIIITLLALCICACMLCSCGNVGWGPGNFDFKHIHFADGTGEAHCATVERWYDNEMGIEVKTAEYGAMYLSEGLYTLFESANHCPYCK